MAYIVTGSFMVLDFATGLLKALKNKTFKSSKMREGLINKCSLAICIVFGVLVDYAQTVLDLGITVPLAGTICIYIVLMECGSILENLGSINPQILPEKIKKYFTQLNE